MNETVKKGEARRERRNEHNAEQSCAVISVWGRYNIFQHLVSCQSGKKGLDSLRTKGAVRGV
jgi:hypothetical protein